MDRILLHTCCAGCAYGVAETLRKEFSLEPTLFFYNPNIQPYEELKRRREALVAFASTLNLAYLIAWYDAEEHLNFIKPFSARHDRCLRCYSLRLSVSFLNALEKGFTAISATLLASPHQNHESIKEIGNYLSFFYGIPFLYVDFRPSYYQYLKKYKEAGFYHQKYCGCIFSLEEK